MSKEKNQSQMERKAIAARFHTGVHALNTVLTSVDAKRNNCEIEFFPYGILLKGSNTYKFVYSSNIIDVTFDRE